MKLLGHVDEVTHDHVTGWAANADQPQQELKVRLVIDGDVRGEMLACSFRTGLQQVCPGATGRYEFKFRLSPVIPASESHVIEVIEASSQQLIANGRRWLPAATGGQPVLTPVLVTSTGRSGTTLLMNEFSKRAGVVVADTYPFEIKLASYAAATLKVLTHPRSVTSAEANNFPELAFRELRAAPIPWNQPALLRTVGGPQLERMFRDAVPRRLADTFRNLVLDYYSIIRTAQNKTGASYFAEKLTLHQDLRHATRDLFGPVREIVLVRDPRDYVCSARSFWKNDWAESFQTLRSELPIIEALAQEKRTDVLFIRYEDLVQEPLISRAAIDAFLGLPAEEQIPLDHKILDRHATTKSPAASVGRWKTELTADQASACQQQFRRFMATFGYA